MGLEPNHAGLIESSLKARDRTRGASNLHYVLGSFEELPGALCGIASCISVLFPWGSLLRAVSGAEPDALARFTAVAGPGATIEVVTAIDPVADAGELTRLGLDPFSIEAMADAWRCAGFVDVALTVLPSDHTYQTTWWRRIRQRSERRAVLMTARVP
jgi:hypothetical protein